MGLDLDLVRSTFYILELILSIGTMSSPGRWVCRTCAGASSCQAVSGYDGPAGVGSPVGLEACSLAGTPVNIAPPAVSALPKSDRRSA